MQGYFVNKPNNHSRVWYSFINSFEQLTNPALVPCLDFPKCSKDCFSLPVERNTQHHLKIVSKESSILMCHIFSLKITANCHTTLHSVYPSILLPAAIPNSKSYFSNEVTEPTRLLMMEKYTIVPEDPKSRHRRDWSSTLH